MITVIARVTIDIFLQFLQYPFPSLPKGIIMSSSSGTNLVLQKVEKEANGNYTCRATNGVPSIGHYEESKPFHLDVKYLPVCEPEGVKALSSRIIFKSALMDLEGRRIGMPICPIKES